jgi:hypothetical protein
MFKTICFLNAVLVLPFAVSVLAAPGFTFDQFGIDLGPEGAGVARGYGATALAWGLVCVQLRKSEQPDVVQGVLWSSLVFNATEVAIQVPIALSGIATAMIWGTIGGHLVLAVLSALRLLKPGTQRA